MKWSKFISHVSTLNNNKAKAEYILKTYATTDLSNVELIDFIKLLDFISDLTIMGNLAQILATDRPFISLIFSNANSYDQHMYLMEVLRFIDTDRKLCILNSLVKYLDIDKFFQQNVIYSITSDNDVQQHIVYIMIEAMSTQQLCTNIKYILSIIPSDKLTYIVNHLIDRNILTDDILCKILRWLGSDLKKHRLLNSIYGTMPNTFSILAEFKSDKFRLACISDEMISQINVDNILNYIETFNHDKYKLKFVELVISKSELDFSATNLDLLKLLVKSTTYDKIIYTLTRQAIILTEPMVKITSDFTIPVKYTTNATFDVSSKPGYLYLKLANGDINSESKSDQIILCYKYHHLSYRKN